MSTPMFQRPGRLSCFSVVSEALVPLLLLSLALPACSRRQPPARDDGPISLDAAVSRVPYDAAVPARPRESAVSEVDTHLSFLYY